MHSSKMQVLFVVTEEWYFRSHRIDLARSAVASGFSVHVACKFSSHRTKDAEDGIHYHDLGWSRDDGPLEVASSIFRLRSLIQDLKPDIIHNVALKPIIVGSLATLGTDIKIINAVAGLGITFTNRKPLFLFFSSLLTTYMGILSKLGQHFYVFQNDDDRRILTHKWRMPKHRVHVIRGSGVDLEDFPKLDFPTDGVVGISVVCRMLKIKGVEDIVHASDMLQERGIHHHVFLAGAPDERNPSSIPMAQMRAWSRKKCVSWLGRVDDVRVLHRQCHISALASHGGEGLPKSLLEAAACGRPLVATNVPGIREIVLPGVNGTLVKPQSPTDLADAFQSLIEDQGLMRAYGDRSRQLVETEFSSASVSGQTLALYRDLLSES